MRTETGGRWLRWRILIRTQDLSKVHGRMAGGLRREDLILFLDASSRCSLTTMA